MIMAFHLQGHAIQEDYHPLTHHHIPEDWIFTGTAVETLKL